MITTWALYFVLTLLVELPIALCLAPREQRGRVLLAAAFATLFTHPLLTLVIFQALPGTAMLVLLECGVAALETVALWAAVPLEWRRAVLIAVVMNGVSALSTPLWWHLLG